jgi:hypothetical protein
MKTFYIGVENRHFVLDGIESSIDWDRVKFYTDSPDQRCVDVFYSIEEAEKKLVMKGISVISQESKPSPIEIKKLF